MAFVEMMKFKTCISCPNLEVKGTLVTCQLGKLPPRNLKTLSHWDLIEFSNCCFGKSLTLKEIEEKTKKFKQGFFEPNSQKRLTNSEKISIYLREMGKPSKRVMTAVLSAHKTSWRNIFDACEEFDLSEQDFEFLLSSHIGKDILYNGKKFILIGYMKHRIKIPSKKIVTLYFIVTDKGNFILHKSDEIKSAETNIYIKPSVGESFRRIRRPSLFEVKIEEK